MTKFKNLGKFLKERRLKKGLSQTEVSSHFGYSSPQYVSNWERGLCAPAADILPGLAKILGISPREMIEVIVRETKLELESRFQKKSKSRSA